MKTGLEWIQELDPDVRQKFIANCVIAGNARYKETKYVSLSNLISAAFVWNNTPEKQDFWKEVAK